MLCLPLEAKRISKAWGVFRLRHSSTSRSPRICAAAAKRSGARSALGIWRKMAGRKFFAQSVFSRHVPDGAHTFCTLLPSHSHTQAASPSTRTRRPVKPAGFGRKSSQPVSHSLPSSLALGYVRFRQPSVCARAVLLMQIFQQEPQRVQLGTRICALGRNGGRNSVFRQNHTQLPKGAVAAEASTPVHPELIAVARTPVRRAVSRIYGVRLRSHMYPVPRQHPASRPLALVQIQKGQLRDVIAGCLQPGAALAPSVCTGQPRKLLHTQRGEHRACQKLGNRAARGTAAAAALPRDRRRRYYRRKMSPAHGTAALQKKRARHPAKMPPAASHRPHALYSWRAYIPRGMAQRASPRETQDAYSGNQSSTRSSGCSFPIPNATPAAVEVKLLLSEYISRLSPQL